MLILHNFLSHICLLQKHECSIMGTDHDVKYKNRIPQPDNPRELAPSLALSLVWHLGLTGFAVHSRHISSQNIFWQLDNKWKHLFPKGNRLRSEQLSSWKIYSLGTIFDICLSPLFFPLLSSRVHYQVCALSPVTREQSSIQHSSICNKITNNVQLKSQRSHPWRSLFTLKLQAEKELGYK